MFTEEDAVIEHLRPWAIHGEGQPLLPGLHEVRRHNSTWPTLYATISIKRVVIYLEQLNLQGI